MTSPSLPADRMPSSKDVFVIADIGKNFIQSEEDRSVDEYLVNAKKLIDAAVDAGVDAVKFQTHVVEDEQLQTDVRSPHFKEKDRYSWVLRNTKATPMSFWREIKAYCNAKNTLFFSTPMSRKAAELLTEIDVPLWKVASGDVTDHVLLDYLTSTGKPIILSTGMVSLAELDQVLAYLRPKGSALTVLYCVSKYPCPPEFFNLATIDLLKEKYPDIAIGFSDHSIGHDIALAAAKVGATVIEKHFSFSRDLWGPDHKASMTPAEMAAMVRAIRSKAYESVDPSPYYGRKDRELEGKGSEFRPFFQKSLVAARDLRAGTVLTKDMLYAMRPFGPESTIPASSFEDVLGSILRRDMRQYEHLTPDLLSRV